MRQPTGSTSTRGLCDAPCRLTRHLHRDPAHVRERAAADQLDQQHGCANVRLRWEYQAGSELFIVFKRAAGQPGALPDAAKSRDHCQDYEAAEIVETDRPGDPPWMYHPR